METSVDAIHFDKTIHQHLALDIIYALSVAICTRISQGTDSKGDL